MSIPSVAVADTTILLIDIAVFIQACTNVVLLSEWEPGREDSCLIQCGLWNWRQLLESRASKIFQVVHFNAVTGQNVDLFLSLGPEDDVPVVVEVLNGANGSSEAAKMKETVFVPGNVVRMRRLAVIVAGVSLVTLWKSKHV